MIEMCKICKEKKEVEIMGNGYICNKCYRKMCLYNAALFGSIWWKETLYNHNAYQDNIDRHIKRKIWGIKQKGDIEKQKEEILKLLMEEIKVRLQFYNKDEIFVALLAIKENIRRILRQNKSIDWVVISDISTVNLLMKFTNEIVSFENYPIEELENQRSNFANVICYARRYNMIVENISLTYGKDIKLEDICFEPIETEETEKYFDIYLRNGLNEKPEDYKIKNDIFRKKLEKEDKTPDKILKALNKVLKEEFGFSKKSIQRLSIVLMRMEFPEEKDYCNFVKGESHLFEYLPIFIMEKSLLKNIYDYENENFKGILETFSINKNIDKHEDELELFCFYEIDDLIVFGNFDFAQTISIFEKFLISGHFIDIYKDNLSNNKLVKKAQTTLSKYFSASVADYLYLHGYILPKEKYLGEDVIRAEIDNIEVNGRNILVDNNKKLGDIDVLALNRESKEILLFELKFYKPAIAVKDMLMRDRSLIVDKKVLKHIKERENVVLNNIDEVVKYILGEVETGYSVKSVLLTARTNFYGVQEKEDIEYLTWAQFLEKAKKKEI